KILSTTVPESVLAGKLQLNSLMNVLHLLDNLPTAAAVGEEKNTTITKKCSPHPTSARSTSLKCFGHLLRWRRLIPLNDNLYTFPFPQLSFGKLWEVTLINS
ncbi:MAG: hypothetical protein J6C03_03545, partial [Clostridia bacterium]|nr:hypothetical protein [Clostridia bacterium]